MTRLEALVVLNLEETAEVADIRAARRSLAAQYHPDVHTRDRVESAWATKKMQEINSAADLLTGFSPRMDHRETFGPNLNVPPAGHFNFPGSRAESFEAMVQRAKARRMFGWASLIACVVIGCALSVFGSADVWQEPGRASVGSIFDDPTIASPIADPVAHAWFSDR